MRYDPQLPSFPPPEDADENGLLMIGGCLSAKWMLAGYRRGIFPMPIVEGRRETLAWFSPDPRGILELDEVHVSRSLERTLRRGVFHFTRDQAFAEVVNACAEPRSDENGVWITPRLARAYLDLHARGAAHSLEAWQGEKLVGGIFGIAIGGFFAGESMFHRVTDASKAALVELVRHLKRQGFTLFDVQWPNAHTRSLGAAEIPRARYLRRLAVATQVEAVY